MSWTSGRRRAVERLHAAFGATAARVIRSPGRVNLIGEHTDYNDGFVLPMAIEPALWLAVAKPSAKETGGARTLLLVSDDADGDVSLDLDALGEHRTGWGRYVQGVAWALEQASITVRGMRGAIASDIPGGAGLSSSAALELAVARALVSDGDWAPQLMARITQRAENEWVGVQTGVMDQMSSALGIAGHALLIDCRDLSVTPVPIPSGTSVLIMDTATRRELVGSEYDDRRRQCEEAAARLGVSSLRDVTVTDLERLDEDSVLLRRARHVVTENARTRQAADAMVASDVDALGRLMDESHASLRDDYEVSSTELDTIVGLARSQQGCRGARMTGGGFGGCAVAVVDDDRVAQVTAAVDDAYRSATGLAPRLITTTAVDGTEVVDAQEGALSPAAETSTVRDSVAGVRGDDDAPP